MVLRTRTCFISYIIYKYPAGNMESHFNRNFINIARLCEMPIVIFMFCWDLPWYSPWYSAQRASLSLGYSKDT